MWAAEDAAEGQRKGVDELGTLSAQATTLASACTVRPLLVGVGEMKTRVAALDVASMTPRGGLAGLFDGRARRLKAFHTAYRATAGRTTDLAEDLSRGAGTLAARHEALSSLWQDLRDAVVTLDHDEERRSASLSIVPAVEAEERMPTLDGLPVADEAISLRRIALGRLATLRAARNAEHDIPTRLLELRDGVLAWQAEWEEALGLSGARARPRRPDPARLERTRSTLLGLLDKAQAALEAALTRKAELAGRVDGVKGRNGTASQA